MDHFTYKDGVLHAEDVALDRIADEVGTPVYCYATATLERHYRVLDAALSGALGQRNRLIAYAVKANSNLAVIATFAKLGAGADVVSEGEVRRALAAGVPAQKIVFAGVGKTRDEMAYALSAGVGQFNVESGEELEVLGDVARARGDVAPVALRVNPDVDPVTHAKISTGQAETKFGAPIGQADALIGRAAAHPNLRAVGVSAHIGSQLTTLPPFEKAFVRLAELLKRLRENHRGDGAPLDRIDVGGGLGALYGEGQPVPPPPSDYAAALARALRGLEADVVVEPGRMLVANAGVLLSRVIYRKQGEGRIFLICDAAMNDLVRPAMYDAHHDVSAVLEPATDAPRRPVDIVGPVCETADIFAKARVMPPVAPGALVAFRAAGAYAAVMASEYNSRRLAPEVIVKGRRFEIARPRPTYDEMIGRESMPQWLHA